MGLRIFEAFGSSDNFVAALSDPIYMLFILSLEQLILGQLIKLMLNPRLLPPMLM